MVYQKAYQKGYSMVSYWGNLMVFLMVYQKETVKVYEWESRKVKLKVCLLGTQMD